ncbi:FecR domain-containing protein [bacterium]|nr:FecR domain-containing protein [bacterium]
MGLAADIALPATPQGSSVTGTLMSRVSEDSDWKSASIGQDVKSQWFKTGPESEAVIAFAGDVHMRMSANTVVHVESSSEAGLKVDVPQGNVLTTVPSSGKTPVQVNTPAGVVGSSSGSFIVKVDNKDHVSLEVLEGGARLTGENVTSPQLPGAQLATLEAVPGLVAAAGDPTDQEIDNQYDSIPADAKNAIEQKYKADLDKLSGTARKKFIVDKFNAGQRFTVDSAGNATEDSTGLYVAGGVALLGLIILLASGSSDTQSNGGNGIAASF